MQEPPALIIKNYPIFILRVKLTNTCWDDGHYHMKKRKFKAAEQRSEQPEIGRSLQEAQIPPLRWEIAWPDHLTFPPPFVE